MVESCDIEKSAGPDSILSDLIEHTYVLMVAEVPNQKVVAILESQFPTADAATIQAAIREVGRLIDCKVKRGWLAPSSKMRTRRNNEIWLFIAIVVPLVLAAIVASLILHG